jgi:5'-3' exonuclease
MIALVDGDIIAYSCAAYNEPWGWDECREDIDQLMDRILATTGSDSHQTFISGPDNFRYGINPEYKANRKGKPDPIYRQDANAYLVERYGASVTIGHEADDALGIRGTGLGAECIICSIDKDLKQIAGRHYNWRKDEFTLIDPLDGLRFFYRQLLIGDTSDNIVGVRGIGEVKSGRIINDLESEADMFQAVQAMYNDDTRLLMNGQCLWIMKHENNIWEFPPVAEIES